jgi:hypothetical protein
MDYSLYLVKRFLTCGVRLICDPPTLVLNPTSPGLNPDQETQNWHS